MGNESLGLPSSITLKIWNDGRVTTAVVVLPIRLDEAIVFITMAAFERTDRYRNRTFESKPLFDRSFEPSVKFPAFPASKRYI